MSVVDDELKAYTHRAIPRSPWATVAVAGLVLMVVVGLPVVFTVLLGNRGYELISLGYPGVETAVVATALRSLIDLVAWLNVGSVVAVLVLMAAPRTVPFETSNGLELGILRFGLLASMLLSAALVAVDAADENGLSLARLTEPGAFAYLLEAGYLAKAWVFVLIASVLAFFCALFARRWAALLPVLVLTALSAVAPVVVHQVQVGVDHDFGSDAATFQSIAVAVLFGAAIVLTVRLLTGRVLRPATIRRTLLTMTIAWAVVAATEVILGFFKLAGPVDNNPTPALISARGAIVFGVGIVLGLTWGSRRKWTELRIRVAIITVAVLGAGFLAATVAMTRVPPPQYFILTNISQVFFGFDISATAPTLSVLLTQWRPNILLLVVAVTAVSVYAAAVIRLRRRGDSWPAGRTIAWILGWAVVVLATSSGLGQYAGAQFGTHMLVHMSLNMLAPVLLVLGGVITLLLRATTPHPKTMPAGPHEWITAALHWRGSRVIYSPVLVFIVYIGSYYGLYLTPLFENIIRYHWAHQAMNIHFLAVGYLFYGLVIGVDRPPRPLPPIGKLGFVLAAMPFHAFFGVILMTATTPIAQNFYKTLDFPWMGDLLDQQYLGGGIAWVGGELPLLIVILALGVQWTRQDKREAKRIDRHLDAGIDDEFDEYNRMLARLQDRAANAQRPLSPSQEPRQ